MTRCVLYTAEGGQVTGFLCAGHAAYADEGQDIVCAAVSALTETCVNALERVAKAEHVTKEELDAWAIESHKRAARAQERRRVPWTTAAVWKSREVTGRTAL